MIHPDTFKSTKFNGSKGLVMFGDKMLVYRRDGNTQSSPFCLDLPGGGREGAETPFDTFKRELKEEFDLDIQKEQVHSSYQFPSILFPGELSFFFVTKPMNYDIKDINFGSEGLEWMLMTPQEFLERTDAIPRQQDRVRKILTEIE